MIPQIQNPYRGIYAATLTPLDDRGHIDETRLAGHFADLAAVDGIVGVLCNGHAGESFLLDREERRRVTQIAKQTIGDRAIIVSGVLCEESGEAGRHAADAREAGADAVLVFPPFSWALSQDAAMVLRHHRLIAAAADMPMMLYQASVGAGAMAYRPELLVGLAQLPGVVAVKEGSWEVGAYDLHRRLLAREAPHVAMMASGDEHLFPCFAIGSEGSLVSLAVLMPEAIVALDRAVTVGDLPTARRLHDQIQPLAVAIYGTSPGGHATARLKACMALLGRWPNGQARAPIVTLPPDEIDALRRALIVAGLLDGDAGENAGP
ncbi:dihydrodipicolinate synthase family protein [Acidisoma cladoniae]|uniref:dihydrodipicolinate synthase family protein n=1 Tax=Acidisoma cladoniae TaxID=3040935 RepID=UPI00254F1683|nr:dihydrodipicolinate synthase family protein [Acidisoma sp. PAMC 29798]